jgi:putative membrane protein
VTGTGRRYRRAVIPQAAVQFLRGFLMGSADLVPGVSGGTVALVLGIYRDLIAAVRRGATALKHLLSGNPRGFLSDLRAVDWLFLVPLGAGALAAFVLLRHAMEYLLVHHAEGTAAVFCGLVGASCVLVWRQITRHDALRLGTLAVVTAATFALLGLQGGTVNDPPLWAFPATGAIAICAMILPGISGSFIMLMMGMYGAVLGCSVIELAVFLVGAAAGLSTFSSLLSWMLVRHEQTLLAALLGLMAGSVRVLWPWPNGVGVVTDEATDVVSGTGLALPAATELLGGAALALAAAAVTLVIVRYAEARTDVSLDGQEALVP